MTIRIAEEEQGRPPWGVLLAVPLAAAAAVVAPLGTYVVTLACFGIAHVVTELRYVQRRFGERLGGTVRRSLVVLLAGLLLWRLVALGGGGGGDAGPRIELAWVVLLIAAVVPLLWQRRREACTVAALLTVAVIAGMVWSPAASLVLLALLHNLTPVGFLAERLRGRARVGALAFCGVAFLAVPLWILAGTPLRVAAAGGWWWPDANPLRAGVLEEHLAVYVPWFWRPGPAAISLFSAAVYLQCMHYAVVLGWLPRLVRSKGPVVRGPRLPAVLGTFFLVAFALSFRDARAAYGVFAVVHAWVEVPLLLVALAPAAALVQIPRAAR